MNRVSALLILAFSPASAGLLTPGAVAVLDSNSALRTTFTNNERVTFQQRVFNGVFSFNRITFTFNVLSPAGAQVFQVSGNAVPGAVGNAATQLGGLPISKFYAGPGVYTLQALAVLDGQTVAQQATFVVSSPSILLLYPPNGAQNIADVPLTFRWVSSGASTYKVTVGDNPSFYNALFSQPTSGPESTLSYPVRPPDPREVLAAGQVYYWKVEAFDATGLKIGESPTPYSFTVQTAALSRDLAVIDLSLQGGMDPQGNLPFKVTVKNQGGAAQANIPLTFSVGGVSAPGSPVMISLIGPGEARDYQFSCGLPTGLNQSLAISCVQFSDDNLTNNCKTMSVTRPAAVSTGTIDFGANMSPDQIWQAIQSLLAQQGLDLSDYNLVGMEGQLTSAQLKDLLNSLKNGQADVSLSGPVQNGAVVSAMAAISTAPAAGAPPKAAAASSIVLAEDEAVPLGTEWEGLSPPLYSRPSGVLIKDAKLWRKVWKQVRSESVPKVDFENHMIVAVFAGKGEKGDHAEVEPLEMSLSGLLVRYKFVLYASFRGPQQGRVSVPYRFRVVPRSTVPVQFERIDEKEDVPVKNKTQERT